METEITNIAFNIKSLRRVSGLRQQDFALKFNLKRSSVGAYEEGRANPSIKTLVCMSAYFKVSIDDLIKTKITSNDRTDSALMRAGIEEIQQQSKNLERIASRYFGASITLKFILKVDN